jgi:MFS family permease
MNGASRRRLKLLSGIRRSIESGWIIQGDESNSPRRAIVMHNLTANIIANLIGGNFFTGLMLILQADDAFVGLMTILIFSANLLQLFAPYVLERFERRRPLLISLKIITHIINIIFVGLIPWFPASVQTRLIIFAFLVFIINALNAFMAPGMTVWHFAHIPTKVRVSYFSLISMLNGVGIAIFNLLAALLVDSFKRQGQELWGLELLRGFALLIAVVDVYMLLHIKEIPLARPQRKISIRDLFVKPWGEKVYLRSVLVVFLWSFTANMPGSYYTVYLLRELHIGYSYITGVAAFNVLMLLLFTPLWRKIYMRYSWLKPLSIAIWMLAPHYFVLAFVSEGLHFLYPIAVIWSFLCTCGINLAFSSMAYLNLPEYNQTLFVGFYATANNLGALSAAILATSFVTALSGIRFALFGVVFGEKQLLMLIVGVLMVGVGFGVRHVYHKNLTTQANV